VNDEYVAKVDLSHGRTRQRTTKVIHDMDWICSRKDWAELYCIIIVLSTRVAKKTGKEDLAERYYISRKKPVQKSLLAISEATGALKIGYIGWLM
jgi:hypothetical protein